MVFCIQAYNKLRMGIGLIPFPEEYMEKRPAAGPEPTKRSKRKVTVDMVEQ